MSPISLPLISLLISALLILTNGSDGRFPIEEATLADIQAAFADGALTSVELVDFYTDRIARLNPALRAVLEVNPDARWQAERADRERSDGRAASALHGVPVLLKDSIATLDALNTTAGSYALLGASPERDATVAERLRLAGAVILGKASMSEWYGLRSSAIPRGWCARAGQGVVR